MSVKKENKYYTPTIEEFHVGFDMEIHRSVSAKNHKMEWIPIPFGRWTSPNNQDKLYDHLNNEKIRVKYLYKEDIESLGFESVTVPNCYNDDELEDGYQLYISNTDLLLLHISDDYIVSIVKQHIYNLDTLNWEAALLFKGKIKNKSELKVIIKQLGIV